MSALKINYSKSILSGVGVDRNCGKNFAYILECEAKPLPIEYLGLPLGSNPGLKSYIRQNKGKAGISENEVSVTGGKSDFNRISA